MQVVARLPIPKGRRRSGVLSPIKLAKASLILIRAASASGCGWERNSVRGHFALAYETLIEQTLDELAAHFAAHIDMEALLRLMR
jgi:hypothetical protein